MLITTPRYIVIEKKGIDKLENILSKLNLKNPLVISGKNTKKYIKKYNYTVVEYSNFKDIFYNNENNNNINSIININDFDSIIGIGGGMAIDTGKYLSCLLNKQFVSIPTTASNDGIASPIIANRGKSIKGEAPIAIIADLDIIEKSPKRLLSAGMGDIVSNITAVLDWELAHREIKEMYSESSGIFSKTIAIELIDYVLENNDLKEYSKKLLKALIGSGITISIANSTRPASGSEHLFSHSLDKINKENNNKLGIHGEQCGIGTIISSYLHYKEGNISKEEYINIKIALEKVGAPINRKQIGLDEDILIEALINAHKIRNRYTIFRNGLSKEKAKNILENTYII